MALLLIPFTLLIWFSTLYSRACRNITSIIDLLTLGSRQTSTSSIASGEVRAIIQRQVKVVIARSSISSIVGLGTSLTTKLSVIVLKAVFSSFSYAKAVYYYTVYCLASASKLARLVGRYKVLFFISLQVFKYQKSQLHIGKREEQKLYIRRKGLRALRRVQRLYLSRRLPLQTLT